MSREHKPPVIVVLGGINMDLICTTPRLPAPGETLIGDEFYTTPGGKGANQAVAAARLGAHVRMVGRVGADSFGPPLLDGLRGRGIDVTGVADDPDHASGVAMILLDPNKQNHIVAVYGANSACDEIQLKAAKKAMEHADALLLQNEIPVPISMAAARHARSMSVRVVWDPAPVVDMPPNALGVVDVLTPNQTEATALTGITVKGPDSAQAAAKMLLDRGVPLAIVKLGDQGVCYAADGESGHVPAFAVDVVDTVAAGDAFGAALAMALCEGRGLRNAVRYGAAAGALAVTRPGAQDAMASRVEVDALLARQ